VQQQFDFNDRVPFCYRDMGVNYKPVVERNNKKYDILYVGAITGRKLDDAYHVELDMLLMSKCKNNIISNSSFSWWAAWLNENKNKTVIAPSKWFKKDIKHDIIPESWVKL
jgi:hypothetical protein